MIDDAPTTDQPNRKMLLIAAAVLLLIVGLFGLSRLLGGDGEISGDGSGAVATTTLVVPPTITNPSVDGDTSPPADPAVPADVADFEAQQRIAAECRALLDLEPVTSCLRSRVEAGELPAYYVSVELDFPECGVGELTLGTVAREQLSDAEYTAIVTTASTCFGALIASGTILETDVPAEYLRPECAEGRNPWNVSTPEGAELYDRWAACALG